MVLTLVVLGAGAAGAYVNRSVAQDSAPSNNASAIVVPETNAVPDQSAVPSGAQAASDTVQYPQQNAQTKQLVAAEPEPTLQTGKDWPAYGGTIDGDALLAARSDQQATMSPS